MALQSLTLPACPAPPDEATVSSGAQEQAAHYLRAAFENAETPMFVANRDGRVLDANRSFVQLSERPLADIVGAERDELLEHNAEQELQHATAGRLHPAAGPPLAVGVRSYPCRANEQECLLYVVVSEGALDDRVKRFERDPLTELPNRAYFDRRLAAAMEEGGPPFALMFLDLDDFKPVNDQLGHAAGDHVLTAVARRLATGIRPGDVLSRRGGDEFTLLLPGVANAEEARQIAERLWQQSQTPLEVDGRQLSVGVSIGVVFADGSVRDAATLLVTADRAMYAAKRRGTPVLAGEP